MEKIVEKVNFSFLKNLKDPKNCDLTHTHLVDLQNQIDEWNKKATKIQLQFDFTIPNYILDEIIEQENNKCKDNLYYLINCAVLNNSLTEENAKKLREIY